MTELKSINATTFSKAELEMYNAHLSKRRGAKQQVITLSGLSPNCVFWAFRGGSISKATKQKITRAILKVIQNIQSS